MQQPPDLDAYIRVLHGMATKAEADAVRSHMASRSPEYEAAWKEYQDRKDRISEEQAEARALADVERLSRLSQLDEPSGSRIGSRAVLINGMVTVALVFITFVLVIPAWQASREAARRMQCPNNLKAIALACAQYSDIFSSYPPAGASVFSTSCGRWVASTSWLLRLTPQMGLETAFNSYNLGLPPFDAGNSTTLGVRLGNFWCPSDRDAESLGRLKIGDFPDDCRRRDPGPGGPAWDLAHSNYAGCGGIFPSDTGVQPNQINKVFRTLSTRGIFSTGSGGGRGLNIASMTDGAHNTILAGERCIDVVEPAGKRPTTFPWTSGAYSDTIFTTLYPINPNRLPGDLTRYQTFGGSNASMDAASSHHYGGASFAFLDGSVHFIREGVDSWKIDPTTGLPPGLVKKEFGFELDPNAKYGIYQALSTRGGGELINPESY